MSNRRLLALLLTSAVVGACSSDRAGREPVGDESLAGTVCAPPAVLEGVDVSYYQSSADFAQAKASGRAFAITRVSDGLGFVDPKFDAYYAGIKAAGMVRGAYQYFEPAEDPIAQADLVLSKIGGALSPGDLPPTIDMEKTGTGLSAAKLTSAMKAWLDHVESALGVKPIIYTGRPYWTGDMGDPPGYQDYPLWIAGYPCNFSDVTNHTYCPKIPDSWSKWTFWQYSDGSKQSCATDGVTPKSVPGIAGDGGDRDFFPGTLADLLALAGGGAGGSGTGGTGGGGTGAGGSGPTGVYAAKYVSQSWPLSSDPAIQMQVGQTLTGSIDLKNTGTVTWKSGVVELAPIPRDQASAFHAASWISPVRVSTPAADVPPGQVGHFEWDLAASAVGDFSPYFGLVADGIVWFADSGGPPDDDIQVHVVVSSGAGVGAGGQAGGGSPGTGGNGPATGAGGASTGTGGASTGAGGLGSAGTKSGAGGAPSAGGATSSVGGTGIGASVGGAPAGHGGATGAAGTGGKGGAGIMPTVDVVDEDSGSSGGCSVESRRADAPASLAAALLGLFLVARGRRRGDAARRSR